MTARLAAAWIGAALLALLACTAPAAAQRQIGFPGPDGERLIGVMFRPAGSGPFPGVVALHGCGGLWTADGRLSARDRQWGRRLAGAGFLVLMPDSFGSRGLGPQCTEKTRTVRATAERPRDAKAALAHLAADPEVVAGRLALIGWSNGAMTLLHTLLLPDPPALRAAVAFYPGCRDAARLWAGQNLPPLLMLLGERDDWTAPGPCRDLAGRFQGALQPAELMVYPGAYHGFDSPSGRVVERSGIPGVKSGTVHVGTNPAARADALARVPAFLAAHLR